MEYIFIRVRPKKTDPLLWKATYIWTDNVDTVDAIDVDEYPAGGGCEGFTDESCIVPQEVVLVDIVAHAYGIKKDKRLDAETFEKLMEENQSALCRHEGLKIVHRSSQCKRGVVIKLINKGFPKLLVGEIVNALEKEGYIDDSRFAEGYIALRGHRESKRALEEALRRKGLDSDVIRRALEEYADSQVTTDGETINEDEYELDKALFYLKRKTPPCLEELDREGRFKATQKYMAALARKGFSGSVSKRAFAKWIEGSND